MKSRWFFLFFLISGFCSLVYEVIWLRLSMAKFGVTTPMVSIVLSVFMAGLGLVVDGRQVHPATGSRAGRCAAAFVWVAGIDYRHLRICSAGDDRRGVSLAARYRPRFRMGIARILHRFGRVGRHCAVAVVYVHGRHVPLCDGGDSPCTARIRSILSAFCTSPTC